MIYVDYFNELFLNILFSKYPLLNNLYIIIFFLCLLQLYNLNLKEKEHKWVYSHRNSITFLLIVICLITVGLLASEKFYYPEPPKDKFVVAISPFYLDNFKSDCDTAEELKEKIEISTEGRINAEVLDLPPITDDKDAISRGKKAGASLVIYGVHKEKIGVIHKIEFHIVPTNIETPLQSEILDVNGNATFEAEFCPYTSDPKIIVES